MNGKIVVASQHTLTGWAFKRIGLVGVNRARGATNMLLLTQQVMSNIMKGMTLVIFPEGTRCKETTLEHMETGCAFIALRSKVPLLPVLIDKPFRFFRITRVIYGRPVDISDLVAEGISAETAEKLNARIREAILSLADSGT